jgi:putative ABC transport system ATP-binding protein
MAISHRAQHFPQQLSGGQQQRVAIARAVVAGPKLILADEPTGNLDSHSSQEIMNILKTLHAEGRTVIVITHDNDIAANAKRIIHIEDGRITSDSANEGNLSREDIAEEIRGNSTMYESNKDSSSETPELNQTEEIEPTYEPSADDYDLEINDNNIDLHLMNGENKNEQEE